MNPSKVKQKLNIHAARDGTAAGRYGGAPREHFIFSNHTRVHTRSNTNIAKEDEEKTSSHLLSTMIL